MKTKNQKALPKIAAVPLTGAVVAQYKRCGKPGCRCSDREKPLLHGPYWYRVWREKGVCRKVYVRATDLHTVRAACATSAEGRHKSAGRRRATAEVMNDCRKLWEAARRMDQLLLEMKRGTE